MLWVIRLVAIGAAAAVGYLLGDREGQRKVADSMVNDPKIGRAVLERLAKVHGAKLEMFETAGQ